MMKVYLNLIFLFFSISTFAQNIVTITDNDLNAGENYTWTKENVYLLDGNVFLDAGAVLNIQPGTIIKGKPAPSTGDITSALIVTKGAQIFAQGTSHEPIIFTSELDDLSTSSDLTALINQTWGGLIILGNSIIGEDGGTDFIEGIPTTEPRGVYGGDNPDDSSGILKYVSIRHGGAVLGADNEINGLTLGGVGSGTIIDYVEVFANKDDGIEIFGGTVNISHAVVAFVGDDSFDFDESWDGYMQYLFGIQQGTVAGVGDHIIEYDGSEEANGEPKSVGRIYNGTFIGSGANSQNTDSDGLRLRNDGAAEFWNCIWMDFPGYAFRVDDTSVDRLNNGESAFANNYVYNYGTYVRNDDPSVLEALEAGQTSKDIDPSIGGISRMPNQGLDPRLNSNSPALFSELPLNSSSDPIEVVNFAGAFNNRENWALGWTAMDEYGYFGDLNEVDQTLVQDNDIMPGAKVTLTADREWVLDGNVFVDEGACLIIEPGTVIRGRPVPSTGDITSALIVAKGGTIIAEGTKEEPIIFTSELDDLSTTNDLTALTNQTWGGLIILGNSIIGEDGGTDFIEGIPTTEARGAYGGDNPNDNSGILKYVSLRHGGAVLGADNEINGLTLGGVGSGTTIDYVEVFANKDDGIEIFGGTVNLKHTVVAFVGDDAFDFDESWDGNMQFLFGIQQNEVAGVGDHMVEYDGSEEANGEPKTVGRIYNATFIGSGVGSVNTDSDGLRLRNDAAAQFWNTIWMDYPGYAIRVDDTSIDRLAAGESAFASNMVYNYGTYVRNNDQTVINALTAGGVEKDVNPMLGGVSRSPNAGLDPRPNSGSPALTGAATPTEDGIAVVNFKGAFNNRENWALGWTAMDEYGYFGDLAQADQTLFVDNDINAGENVTLTADKEWLLDGFVFVEDGASLTIEPGTVVRGRPVPSTGDLTSAIIVARGGTILAEGTADAPIIFTSELDDLSTTADLTALSNQTWGGLIILGKSIVGEDGGTDFIEGIPSTEERGQYGGNVVNDNSGILKYISIRHGGAVLGADNEINGLTLGGVGKGTTIDYVEVFANKDDGIEIFGGTVNVKHAVVGFVGDDSFDFDESWDGYIQHVFALQSDGTLGDDHCIEYDGSEEANGEPKTVGRIYNGTFIGSGINSANSSSDGLRLRNDAAVQIWNSIFTDIPGYVFRVDDTSIDRLQAGESAFANNLVYNYGTYARDDNATVLAALAAGSTDVDIDPMLGGISRSPNMSLDPRLRPNSPALTNAATVSEQGVDVVDHRGAFGCDENWAMGWTAMDEYGYFGEEFVCTVSTDFAENAKSLRIVNLNPNPGFDYTNLNYELPEKSAVNLAIIDFSGKVIKTITLGEQDSGIHTYTLDTASLESGFYMISLQTELGFVNQKFMKIRTK